MSALTSKQVEVVGVEQLEAKKGKNDLNRERATIHKVTIEQLNAVVKHYDAQVLDKFVASDFYNFRHRKVLQWTQI